MDDEDGGSPDGRPEHCDGLVVFAYPGINLLVAVAVCGHLAAQVYNFLNTIKWLAVDGEWVFVCSIFSHNLPLPSVDLKPNAAVCLSEASRLLLGVLMLV